MPAMRAILWRHNAFAGLAFANAFVDSDAWHGVKVWRVFAITCNASSATARTALAIGALRAFVVRTVAVIEEHCQRYALVVFTAAIAAEVCCALVAVK